MGNLLGVGNRPRQGRAVLEIAALLWVLRRMSAKPSLAQQAAMAAAAYTTAGSEAGEAQLDRTRNSSPAPSAGDALAASSASSALILRNNSRRPSTSSMLLSASPCSPVGPSTPLAVGALPTRVGSWLTRLNCWLRQFHPLQVVLAVLILVHINKNMALLLGLNAPHHSMTQEPDVHYSTDFARVRWLLTGLDAATLSTLKVRIAPLRHALTLILSVYYIANLRRAENQVNAFRRSMTHEAIRACWEKGSTPVLALVDKLMRKRCAIDLELVSIPSPDGHPIECRLFYSKSREELAKETRLLLDYPGGGFIAMSPQHHADYLSFWAQTLNVPVLSVNYRKAPEFPFPCGFEDAWHVYKSVVDSNGGVAGINVGPARSESPIKIAVVGDSAGGNLTATVTIQAILQGVRVPDGVVLIYPVLDLGTANFWKESSLPPSDVVIRAQQAQRTCTPVSPEVAVLGPKKQQPHRPASAADAPDAATAVSAAASSITASTAAAVTSVPSSASVSPARSSRSSRRHRVATDVYAAPQLSSRALYTQDGVLPLKYMQLIGDALFRNGGDPVNNPLISPAAASQHILAHFPPIYAHAGSVDPLVDDLLRFGARCVLAKPDRPVSVCLLPKVSHAYMHVANFLPAAKLAVDLTARWIGQILGVDVPIASIDERMQSMRIIQTDLKEYQLTQFKSKKQLEDEYEQSIKQEDEERNNGSKADAAATTEPVLIPSKL